MLFERLHPKFWRQHCSPYLPNWEIFIFPYITMYKSSISMMTFSKLLPNFAPESMMTS